MEQFWNFLYYSTTIICITFIVKYICKYLVLKLKVKSMQLEKKDAKPKTPETITQPTISLFGCRHKKNNDPWDI